MRRNSGIAQYLEINTWIVRSCFQEIGEIPGVGADVGDNEDNFAFFHLKSILFSQFWKLLLQSRNYNDRIIIELQIS